MARLNEPLMPAAESLDALKRRFIRQNREIARVNSNQSQRIRNLETEISRLLAENIALREQAIRANEKAEKLRTSSRLGRDVSALKGKLASKLEEVNLLVAELGGLPEKAARRSSVGLRRSVVTQNPARSPDTRDWKSRQTLGGVLNPEQEGRLPAIIEDKYYPRRTLEAAELRALGVEEHTTDIESPELGPPPVVHFDVNDPIIFDSKKSPTKASEGFLPDEGQSVALPSTLETRRKRRNSSLVHDLLGVDESGNTNKEPTTEQEKPGTTAARRNVSSFELEEKKVATPQDDFVFQKRPASISDRPRPSRFTSRTSRPAASATVEQNTSPQKLPHSSRQALAPISTNSPTKSRSTSTLLKKDNMKAGPGDEPKPRPARAITMTKVVKPQHIDVGPPVKEVDVMAENSQPKTPGTTLLEVMSPDSITTEPTDKFRDMSKAEIAFTNSLEDVLNGSIGRGSRRARAAVSYAEPNLRDKMRRPDKKLVGAVEGLSKGSGGETPLSRSLNSEPAELIKARQSLSEITSASHKQVEPGTGSEESDQRHLPSTEVATQQEQEQEREEAEAATTPLQDKQRTQVLERRHKRTFSEIDSANPRTASRKTTDDIAKGIDQLSIFDPPSSSPIAPPKDEAPSRPASRSSTKDSVTTSRRTTPSVSSGTATSTTTIAALKTRRHSIQAQPNSINNLPSRPHSAAAVRDTTSRDPSTTRLKRASSVQAMARLQDNVGSNEVVEEPASSRPVGTRRRSMMV